MDKREKKIGSVLCISFVFITILFSIFAESSWAKMPSLEYWNPGDDATNVLINTDIRIRFDMQMNPNPTNYQFELWDNTVDQEVPGTVQWTQSPVTGDNPTSFPNDTLIFTPTNALRPARSYSYEGFANALIGGSAWFEKIFITKFSTADTTPPTVQTTYPSPNMTLEAGQSIFIKFSETMDSPSITTAGNITLTGLCMGGATDYTVNYDIGSGDVEIRKATPFVAGQSCTVTVTTNVRDLRGNPLKTQYSWSFWAGAADTTSPIVTQTIPASGDIKVNLFPDLYAIFSEGMDESTFTPTNITLYDNTVPGWVNVNIYWSNEDVVSFGPQSSLTYNHNYTVTIGTGVKDRAGNPLVLKTWSFTTAANSLIDSDPKINWGLSRDDQIGQRFSDGSTKVLLGLGAWDDVTKPTVTATTPPAYFWILTGSPGEFPGGYNYSYESAGNESLSPDNHLVTFIIRDGDSNQVSFQRNIYIFSASPTLISPTNGATGVSTTPTFTWSYSGSPRPMYYNVALFDGPDMNQDRMVWVDVMVDKGSVNHSITIPADKQLSPNKTYYWGVRGANKQENGETFAGLWPFTTTGTPPPAPRFAWTWVRSDDRPIIGTPPVLPAGLQWNLAVRVAGPSPADIVELKVTGPGGFQYIFTEDDILQGEQNGLSFWKMMPGSLPNGQYTFTVTDSMGRTAISNYDFVNPSGTIPRVSSTSMVPGNNSYSVTTTPTLQWGSVGQGYYYRVRVMDWTGRLDVVYQSPFIQDTQFTIPSGYLIANTSYKWRVEVYEGPGSKYNRSVSETFAFSTGAQGLNLVWGVIWAQNDHYMGQRTSLNALVTGALPSEFTLDYPNNTFLRVTVTPPSGPPFPYYLTVPNVGYHFMLEGDFYGAGLPGFPPDGDYTFTAQVGGGSDTYNKTGQVANPIAIVDQSSMFPANNAYLTSFTPTFQWNLVTGSPRYYRILISSWRTNYNIYQSTRTLNQSSFTIPAGILKANQSYKWRVDVFDDSNVELAENSSNSGSNCFSTPRPSLVDHYYTSILKRTPDPGGKAYWESEVERTQTLGIDIKEAYMVMSGNFFNSPEYYGFQSTNEEFLNDLYLTFFDRAPDSGGLTYWLGELSSGSSRDMVMYYFMFSPEFYSFMSDLFGDTTTRAEIYPVVDFYRGFMNRLPDPVGFGYWLNRFRTAQCVGAAAVTAEADAISSLFLSSGEYTGRVRTNAQYVQDLYYAFMRRYATATEVGYWVGELNTGAKTREWLRLFFLQCPEFDKRVDAMIAQGCYSP